MSKGLTSDGEKFDLMRTKEKSSEIKFDWSLWKPLPSAEWIITSLDINLKDNSFD